MRLRDSMLLPNVPIDPFTTAIKSAYFTVVICFCTVVHILPPGGTLPYMFSEAVFQVYLVKVGEVDAKFHLRFLGCRQPETQPQSFWVFLTPLSLEPKRCALMYLPEDVRSCLGSS